MPAASVQVRRAAPEDRLPLARMLELYQHDLSDVWDQDLDAHGEYGYPLDRYWTRGDGHAFIALVRGRYAGFALVDRSVKVGSAGSWMDQFFVLKKYRRRGLGRVLAQAVFDALPGPWEVGQMPGNVSAQAFWRQVIGEYTKGDFVERQLQDAAWVGPVQCFRAGRSYSSDDR